jgi:hypothetical protein
MKWEYYVIGSMDPASIQTSLDEAGEDGWELVAVSGAFYYFKRPKLDTGDSKSEPSQGEEILPTRKFRKPEESPITAPCDDCH